MYECIFSCRPKELALKEVLSIWSTYRENFEKLAFAAMIVLDKDEIDKNNPNIEIFDDNKINIIKDIIDCTKKIVAEKISADEYINEIFLQHTKEFGVEPIIKLIGLNNSGRIYGIFNEDNNLLSNMGFLIKLNESSEESEKNLINLLNLRM